MMDAARELCVRAGQPWRAASLGGAAPGPGGFAPAPVGAAADAAFAASAAFPVAAATEAARRARAEAGSAMDADGREALAETDTSLDDEAAFEAIAAAADSPAADAEDEELAAECDDVGSASSSSQTWVPKSGARRRALWKWACAETARQILAAPTAAPSARLEAALYGACAGDVRATLPACEGDWEASAWAYFRALLDARVDAAVDGAGPEGAYASQSGPGPGPGPALLDDDDAGAGAEDDAAFETAPRWPTAASAAATRTAEEILETLRPLAARGARGARARLAQRDAQRCLILGRTRELAAEAAPRWVFPSGSGEDFEASHAMSSASMSSASASSPPPGLLRFAAHLLLFLQTALPDGGGLQAGGALHFHLNKVVNLYVVHLIARRRYALVPLYARRLRAPVRLETYARFLSLLAPASLETKKRIVKEALEWIPMEHEGGLRAIVARALDESREVVDPLSGAADGAAATRGPGTARTFWSGRASPARTRTRRRRRTRARSCGSSACPARPPRWRGTNGAQVTAARPYAARRRTVVRTAQTRAARARRVVAELLPADLRERRGCGRAARRPSSATGRRTFRGVLAARGATPRPMPPPPRWRARGARRRRRRRRRAAKSARAARRARAPPWTRPPRSPRRARPSSGSTRLGGWGHRRGRRSDGFWLDSEVLVDAPKRWRGAWYPATPDATPAGGSSRRLSAAAPRRAPHAPRVRGGAAARRRGARGRAPGPRRARRGGAREAVAGARDEPEARPRARARALRGQVLLEVAVGGVSAGGASSRPRASRCACSCASARGAGRARARGGGSPGTRASGRGDARA